MALASLQHSTTVDEDTEPGMMDYLQKYGYVLKQPNGYMMLAGFLNKRQLQYAKQVIEAKYPPAQMLTLLAHPPRRQLDAAA